MRAVVFILILFSTVVVQAQQGFTFTRFTTEDGSGLLSNVVSSIYQDEKGFIWVGTANGLQRFDGTKFIQFGVSSGDVMPYSYLSQVLESLDFIDIVPATIKTFFFWILYWNDWLLQRFYGCQWNGKCW